MIGVWGLFQDSLWQLTRGIVVQTPRKRHVVLQNETGFGRGKNVVEQEILMSSQHEDLVPGAMMPKNHHNWPYHFKILGREVGVWERNVKCRYRASKKKMMMMME
jgi:hypothetical protein